MTCIKTGCHAFLVPYNEFVYGDAFEIEPILPADADLWRDLNIRKFDTSKIRNTAYFHLVARSREPINNLNEVHYVIHDWDNWFNSGELSSNIVRLNCSFLMTNNFTRETLSLDELAERIKGA
jgi:hypothetical protein